MTVFEVAILERLLDFEGTVVTKELVTRGNINVVAGECDAAQAPVGAAAFEIDFLGVPVDVLFAFLFLEIDGEDAAMTFALLAAPHDRGRDQLG
jgi:hypothetical protein